MDVLIDTINRLNRHVNEVPQNILKFSDTELSFKPKPEKWSKKEILGHLCDSALNNLSRFIRAQFEAEPFAVTPYMQDDWVKINHYQEMKIDDIVNLWMILNKRIINVVLKIPENKLGIECDVSSASFREIGERKSLLWLIEDYLVHMEYHLKQLGIEN
jgi:hypothetical protein